MSAFTPTPPIMPLRLQRGETTPTFRHSAGQRHGQTRPAPPPPPQQQPAPIYSQTVVIPQAPPPPPEAYQAQQYAPRQQPPVLVQPADVAQYHPRPTDASFQHIDRARSIQTFDFDNKLFREQANSFAQNQEKVRVPPPPERFVPSLATLYSLEQKPHEKNPEYHPDTIIVDRNHSAYFEDTQRTRPKAPKIKVQGGSFHSSSANVPQPRQQQLQQQQIRRPAPVPQQPTRQQPAATVISSPQQQTFRPDVRPAPQRPIQRPRPVVSQSQVRRPVGPRPQPAPVAPQSSKSHLAPAPVQAAGKPRTASEKFLQCCKGRRVAQSCERICSFDVLSKKTLTGMFLGTDPCPQAHGLDMMQCAADSDDHTECCLDREVDRTSAGRKCLGFCNMKPGVTFQADVSMLPCWGVLNDIKQCFKENLERQLAAAI
ncbi:unnamed protein product [Caenorhabditis bovis]|uniref:Domain of unknown function DB domain-containing protein n=1 Tax=Caenorhabditis bovis TaxID=2654633 RepID=A0A8S1EX94_9PELO|nr:unnamed protein product [Caenorhabditis bovis]